MRLLSIFTDNFNITAMSIFEYPTHIPLTSHRIDFYTKAHVKRGLINDLYSTNKTVTKKEFDRFLQCPQQQPDLNGKNSSTKHKFLCSYQYNCNTRYVLLV